MKNMIFAAIMLMVTTAQAEPRIAHYSPQKAQNASMAAKNLQSDNDKIAQIIAGNKQLDEQHLEAIHELTYGLESSHKSLKNAGLNKAQMHELGEAIEKLHNVSEEHNATATTEAYREMQTELNEKDIANQLHALTNRSN